jgi:hypothetical protein
VPGFSPAPDRGKRSREIGRKYLLKIKMAANKAASFHFYFSNYAFLISSFQFPNPRFTQ